jgi:hypothetical protein
VRENNLLDRTMPDCPPKKTLEELKNEAIAELECRGYDVRGKTPGQIRQMLRTRPPRPKPTTKSTGSSLPHAK